MKRIRKALSLRSETIRTLHSNTLEMVAGGAINDSVASDCPTFALTTCVLKCTRTFVQTQCVQCPQATFGC